MDISRFTAPTGTVVPISAPDGDYAFIPMALPAGWTFDPSLWPILSEAKRCLGLLDGMASVLPNPELFLKPFQRVESLTSSRLEGTYATAQELMLFELDPKERRSDGDHANVWLEVHNYSRALASGFTQLETKPFCVELVKDLHKTLMTGVRGFSKNPGEFRSHQVHIGSNRRYVPPPHEEAQRCIYQLEEYLQSAGDEFDPLVRSFIVHYQLEAIHPFSDGNGRIGRVVLSLMIYKWCNLAMPWLYLSPYFERYKDEYIDNLFKISTEGAWSRWIQFCLRGVIEQATKAVDTCKKLQDLRTEMHARVKDDGNTRIHAIIERLFSSPLVRIVDLVNQHKVRYATAKSDVVYLEQKGILAEFTPAKIKTFYSPEICTLAYTDSNI